MCSGIALILKVNTRFEIKSYPPKIVKRIAPQTEAEKKGFLLMATPMLLLAIIYLGISCYITYQGTSISFFHLYLHNFVTFMLWNLFDWIVFD